MSEQPGGRQRPNAPVPIVGPGQTLRSLCIVLTAVALFCLLTTLSTAFEHTYDINWKLIDGAYRPCNQTLANVSPTPHPTPGTTPLIPTKATTAWLADEQTPTTTTTSATSATLPSYLEHSDLGSGAGSGSGSSSGIGSGNDSGSGYGESGK